MAKPNINTLGALKASGYQSKTVKEEMRTNLIEALRTKDSRLFKGIQGYEDTVIPQLENAILSKHNVLFLGLRGQAKTRMARLMVELLDEYMPVIEGSELHDDPCNPISHYGKTTIEEKGDDTPIDWVSRKERYSEKLATPDVSVADLVGDIDPIKAANLKLTFGDERVIHFGMIPRANRGIFVINELPDLQARIQVALFNMLQEGDVQIRGFKLRFDLDVQFVFTANPEDYTNRGSIITPLKDRIESQIMTHYPKSLELSKKITHQEASLTEQQKAQLDVHELIQNLIERVAIEARESDFVDQKSGVSARLTIAAYELLHSAGERRLLKNDEETTIARISDVFATVPGISGKLELVYEGELEGMSNVAYYIISKAIRKEFEDYFPDPAKTKKDEINPYKITVDWFNEGHVIDLDNNLSNEEYKTTLEAIPGLSRLVDHYMKDLDARYKPLMMEFALHGLVEYSQLSKQPMDTGIKFKDIMGGLDFDMDLNEEDLI